MIKKRFSRRRREINDIAEIFPIVCEADERASVLAIDTNTTKEINILYKKKKVEDFFEPQQHTNLLT